VVYCIVATFNACAAHVRAVYNGLQEVLKELKRIEAGKQVNEELLSNISLITYVVENQYTNSEI